MPSLRSRISSSYWTRVAEAPAQPAACTVQLECSLEIGAKKAKGKPAPDRIYIAPLPTQGSNILSFGVNN